MCNEEFFITNLLHFSIPSCMEISSEDGCYALKFHRISATVVVVLSGNSTFESCECGKTKESKTRKFHKIRRACGSRDTPAKSVSGYDIELLTLTTRQTVNEFKQNRFNRIRLVD